MICAVTWEKQKRRVLIKTRNREIGNAIHNDNSTISQIINVGILTLGRCPHLSTVLVLSLIKC